MRKRKLLALFMSLIFFVPTVSMPTVQAAVGGTNIALSATASAPYSNTPVRNVNDGVLAYADPSLSWNTFNNSAGYPVPVTLTWDEPQTVSGTQVLWWADTTNNTAGVSFPQDCTLWYLEDAEWVQITDMISETASAASSVGVLTNGDNGGVNGANTYWNGVEFAPVDTTALQLRVNRTGTGMNGIGISEWEVFGAPVTGKLYAANITGKATIKPDTTETYLAEITPVGLNGPVSYAWSVPEESAEIIAIDGSADRKLVAVKALAAGTAQINLTATHATGVKTTAFHIEVSALPGFNDPNIALSATATAGYVLNDDGRASNVNDGTLPTGANSRWHTWNSSVAYPVPLTLKWDEPYAIDRLRILWWADQTNNNTNGVGYPGSCTLWYMDGENNWRQITALTDESGAAADGVGVLGSGTQGANRTWNGVAFEPVTTRQIQLRIDRPATASGQYGVGIGELEVFGRSQEEVLARETVFQADFNDFETGTDITEAFSADTGQILTPSGKVSVAEGRKGANDSAIFLDNVAANAGYLSTPNTAELNPQDLSVSFWLKRTGDAELQNEGRVLWAKGTAWNQNGWFAGWTKGESMCLVTDGDTIAGIGSTQANNYLPLNEWTHYAATFDSATGTLSVYQDSVLLTRAVAPGASVTQNDVAQILIGNSGYNSPGLGCVLDDLQIFKTALSPAQIMKLAEKVEDESPEAELNAISLPARATADFSLATVGRFGSAISWQSSGSAVTVSGNTAVVTRADADVSVTMTATLMRNGTPYTKEFSVTVAKIVSVDALQKLGADEIIDVDGFVGTRIKEAFYNYTMDYMYNYKPELRQYNNDTDYIQNTLNEYKNHSHSAWNWEQGEQPGKWLEAAALSQWMSDARAAEVDAAIEDVVTQLAASQTAENKNAVGYNRIGGYLGNGTAAIRNSAPLKGMDPYESYSVMNGLMLVYENYKESNPELAESALSTVVKYADYLVATVGDETTYATYADGTSAGILKSEFWPKANANGTSIAGHGVHQGLEGSLLIDPMSYLAYLVSDTSYAAKANDYSAWCDWVIANIDKWSDSYRSESDQPYANLDKVASGEMTIDQLQGYVHAHTFQMNFLGLLKKFQETGDEAYLEKVVGAWEDITARQMYITGTVSVGEHYESGHQLPNTGSVAETCASNSWALLTQNLFELLQEPKYQQVLENLIFNHMFATSTIDGDGYSYHRPLNGTTDRFYQYVSCCTSSGERMQAYVPYYLYAKSDSDVYVNQFVSSEVQVGLADGKALHLIQTTDYPTTDVIDIEIGEATTAESGKLYIRVPDWVEGASAAINGTAVNAALTPDSYFAIEISELAAGDHITVTYPSVLRWVKGEYSNEGRWTMKKGPMVYAINAAFMTAAESQAAYGSDNAPVNSTSLINPADGEPVAIESTIDFSNERYLGKGYRVKMYTAKGEQDVTAAAFANISQWYRYGTAKPASYTSGMFQYSTWISALPSDYPEPPEPKNEPILHYTFDSVNGTTVPDVSGSGNDGTLFGGTAIGAGRLDNAVTLNGTNGYVQLPDDTLYGLYDMTVASWVNPSTIGNWARVFDFGAAGDPPHPNLFLTLKNSTNANGVPRFAYEHEGGTTNITLADAFTTNAWQHLAVTISGAKAEFYVNGVKVAENASFNYVPYNAGAIVNNFIGKSN
ncbi:MAG: glycoside hydrolase family 127 protein, partial [Clostridiales bacterium]|nr:glycoside hydrolase family 127 protein [Clostridiales bacterium]